MKIAYLTTFDSSNKQSWSGSGYHMHAAMKNAGCSVELFGNLTVERDFYYKIKKAYYKFLLAKNYQKQREPAIVKSYGLQLSKKLENHSYNVILSPGTIPIAYLKNDKPIVFWTDATFAGMVDFFPDFSNLPEESIRHGNEMEQAALENCALAIYTSEWAAASAIRHYNVRPDKVKIIPFGANMERDPDAVEITWIAERKKFDVCRLLFVGVDWHRKGGDMAIKVATHLNQSGIKTELHLLGSKPDTALPDYVIAHGFLPKSKKAEIDRLYEQSHFLILPSIADCVPVVIAEANSYGLPCVSTTVGGICSAITNGINGQTFSLTDGPEKYAAFIANLFSSPDRYKKMVATTFDVFKQKLNWNVAAKEVKALLSNL